MLRSIVWAGLSVCCFMGNAVAQPALPADIEYQIKERIAEGHHQGVMIAYLDQSGVQYHGFGQVSLKESTAPDENSIFEIASLTKGFTALLIADLGVDVEESLDAYIPELTRVSEKTGQPVTIESLLTHTAGLPRDASNVRRNDSNRYFDYTVADLKTFLTSPPSQFGAPEYRYSNVGFAVLEHAIEERTGSTYEELLDERVFQKLGLTSTYTHYPENTDATIVTGFNMGKTTEAIDTGQFPAMGGLQTTAKDMMIYLGAQIGLVSTRLAPAIERTHDVIYRSDERTLTSGWRVLDRPETDQTIYHFSGGSNGFVSFAAFDKDNQKAVVVLVSGRGWFSDLGFKLLDPTYPLRDPGPAKKASIWERLASWFSGAF